MGKAKTQKTDKDGTITVCRNRRALHEYAVLDTLECGIVLVGTEVKSLREGHAHLEEAFARVERNEVFLIGCEIPEYLFGNRLNHKPKRTRKLLLNKSEIAKFAAKSDEKGFTLVPLRIYFKDGRAKVELAMAVGKQTHDKRQTLKNKDAKREIDRAMREKGKG